MIQRQVSHFSSSVEKTLEVSSLKMKVNKLKSVSSFLKSAHSLRILLSVMEAREAAAAVEKFSLN